MLIARELACKTEQANVWTAEVTIEGTLKKTLSYCDTLNAIKEFNAVGPPRAAGIDLSRDAEAAANFLKDFQLLALKDIYEKEFPELTQFNEKIGKEVNTILIRVKNNFGGLQFVIKNFDELKASLTTDGGSSATPFGHLAGGPAGIRPGPPGNKLKPADLDRYPLVLFNALDRLFYIPDGTSNEEKVAIGVVVATVLEDRVDGLEKQIENWDPNRYAEAEKLINQKETSSNAPIWVEKINEKLAERLTPIYSTNAYELAGYEKTILSEINRILEQIKVDFKGCLACAIETDDSKKLVNNKKLHYHDRSIIEGLQGLIDYRPLAVGALSPENEFEETVLGAFVRNLQTYVFLAEKKAEIPKNIYIASTIGKSVACNIANKLESHQEFGNSIPKLKPEFNDNRANSYCQVLAALDPEVRDNSRRVYNVVSVYDGTDLGFLEKWWKNQPDIRKALRQSAGTVHEDYCDRSWSWRSCRLVVNDEVERVGIVGEKPPDAWKPGEFTHGVPTLVLEGTADPVTAGEQAEQVFNQALRGRRVKIKFPGIGHEMELPQVSLSEAKKGGCSTDTPTVDGGRMFHPVKNVRECLIFLFLNEESLSEIHEELEELNEVFRKKEGFPIELDPREPTQQENNLQPGLGSLR